jgi:hypothetical protein
MREIRIFRCRELKLTLRNYTKNTKNYAANVNTIFGTPNILLLKCLIFLSFLSGCSNVLEMPIGLGGGCGTSRKPTSSPRAEAHISPPVGGGINCSPVDSPTAHQWTPHPRAACRCAPRLTPSCAFGLHGVMKSASSGRPAAHIILHRS